MNIIEIIMTMFAISGGLSALISVIRSLKNQKLANKNVLEAEKEAFQDKPELNLRMEELLKTQDGLEERTKEIAKTVEEIKTSIEMRRLFNLYSKQIEKYQQQTRSRATISFMFAIFSMIAGLGFVIWGGTVLLTAKETIVLAAGGILAAIGGGVGGYITKTFLDVHKLSLNQLNRYFKQPVINDHILMAQRMADDCKDDETRKQAYQKVIESIATLIKEDRNLENS
jgi:DNA-directed RNA polymerase subunit L